MVLRNNFVGAISWSKGNFPLNGLNRPHLFKGTHVQLGLVLFLEEIANGEVLDVPILKVSDAKFCSVGFFGMCYTAYCKKGVIKAFYHPKNCTKNSIKILHIYSILHKKSNMRDI